MKRSLLIATVAAIVSLSVTAEEAPFRSIYQHLRKGSNNVGNDEEVAVGAQQVIEGEQLLSQLYAEGGSVAVQGMLAYGDQWSGNAQLLWYDTFEGARLSFFFDVQKPGTYRLYATYTRAPTYGMVQIYQHGVPLGDPTDCYSREVARGDKQLIGTVTMDSGRNWFVMAVEGKDPLSQGYLVGVDNFTLELVAR